MYKLANNVELIQESLDNGSNEYIVAIYTNNYKDYVVNKITFDFMQHFKEQTTLETVINHYVGLTKATAGQVEIVENQITTFLKNTISKGWIVNEQEEIVNTVHMTLYEKGDYIDDYKILKVLSNNDLTDVYLAKLVDNRKRFVIKYLNPDKFKNKDRYTRYKNYFLNEFKFLDSFNSIYINKGVEFIDNPIGCYMVLQYINGKSIKRYIKQNWLPTKEKITLVTKILTGFSLIHESSIYHGDIHLSNVLVTPKRQIKIIDFGYSNFAVNIETAHHKRRNGGVHTFIPPERALRSISRKFSAVEQYQSEVYQIGLIIYYIFVKELPFESETWKAMVDEKKGFNINVHQPFLNRRMPLKVRRIIAKSLENDPSFRYKNANAMLSDWKKL